MVKAIVPIYKPLGYTSLQALRFWRQSYPQWNNVKMTYTGRLDPLAEGVMVIAVGEALRQQAQLQQTGKTYQAEILFGFNTDSYDILGLPQLVRKPFDRNKIEEHFKSLAGNFKFEMPPFSSYKVKGHPLFWWALHNKLDQVVRPVKEVNINSIKLLGWRSFKPRQLADLISRRLNLLKTNLRQAEILPRWQQLLLNNLVSSKFYSLQVEINCSAGTYVRSIANIIGEQTGSGAVLLSLVRNRVGEYGIEDCERIEGS